MKKNLLIIAAVMAVVTFANVKAKAQASPISSTAVPLSIVLGDAVSITMESTPAVEFRYTTPANYIGSRLVSKPAHFSVFSNRTYTLSVKADAAFQVPTVGPTIPLSAVKVAVNSSDPIGLTGSAVALSTTDATLITPAPSTLGTSFTIDYTIPTSTPLLLVTAGTYTTNVIYTVTQL